MSPNLSKQSPEPNAQSLSLVSCRALVPAAVWAYLVHHQVVVALVPIAILHRGEAQEGSVRGARLDELWLCLAAPQVAGRFCHHHPPSLLQDSPPCRWLPTPSPWGFWLFSCLLAGFLHPGAGSDAPAPPRMLCSTHVMPSRVPLLPVPLQPCAPCLLLSRGALRRGRRNALRCRGEV